jgi:hypothetical protein
MLTVTVAGSGSGSISVNCTASPGAASYRVYGSTDGAVAVTGYIGGASFPIVYTGTVTGSSLPNNSSEAGNAPVVRFPANGDAFSLQGTLKWPFFQMTPNTFAGLAACSSATQGRTAAVTDSTTNTWGATITGSGSDSVMAYCDGTNWTVAAK